MFKNKKEKRDFLKEKEIKSLVFQKQNGLVRFEPFQNCNGVVKFYYVWDSCGKLVKFLNNVDYFNIIRKLK